MPIHLLAGTDVDERKKALKELLNKHDVVEGERYELHTLTLSNLESIVNEIPLFAPKKIIIIDISDAKEDEWTLLANLLKSSTTPENIVVVLETDTITAARKKNLPKGTEITHYDLIAKNKKNLPIAFEITDAFLKKDKRTMWIKFRKALEAGEEIEQIHGALMWQIKCLALAHDHSAAQSAGISPYVYSKSKAGLSHFSREDISRMMIELMDISHESRSEGEDFVENIEKWILHIK